jgi:hypothetical protein
VRGSVLVCIISALLLCACSKSEDPRVVARTPSTPQAPPPSKEIAGLTLGGTLNIPPCKSTKSWETEERCWRHYDENKRASGDPPQNEALEVVFPDDALPTGLLNVTGVVLINGKLESIEFRSLGPSFQEGLYQMLVGKWGKPQTSNVQQLQNGFGANSSSIEASWTFDDFGILFLGLTIPDSGLISIRSGVYDQKVRNEQSKAAKSL